MAAKDRERDTKYLQSTMADAAENLPHRHDCIRLLQVASGMPHSTELCVCVCVCVSVVTACQQHVTCPHRGHLPATAADVTANIIVLATHTCTHSLSISRGAKPRSGAQ